MNHHRKKADGKPLMVGIQGASPARKKKPIRVVFFIGVPILLSAGLVLTGIFSPSLPAGFPDVPDLTNYNEALRQLIQRTDSRARANPRSAEAIGSLAMAYHANLFLKKAKKAYRLAAQLDPSDYRWCYYQALVEEDSGQQEGLIELLKQTIQLQPDYYPASQKLADVFFKQDQLDEAGKLYARVYEADSSYLSSVLGLARVAARKEQWSQVIQYLEPEMQKHPLLRMPYQILLEAYEALKERQKASEKKEILSRSNLRNDFSIEDPLRDQLNQVCCLSTPLLKLAYAAQAAGDLKQMVELCRRAVKVNPADADAQHYLARSLVLAYGSDPAVVSEAMLHRDEGLRLKPEDLAALMQLGQALTARNDLSNAVLQFERILSKKPDHVGAHENLAIALTGLGKLEEASVHYTEAIRLRPDSAERHNNLANLLVRQGRLMEALAHYRKALKLNPQYAEAYNNLGNLLVSQAKWPDALSCYSRATELKPDYAEAHNNLGNVLVLQSNWKGALSQYSKAVELNPNFAEAHYALGSALAKLGRSQEAVSHFSEALRIKPEYAQARESLQALQTRQIRAATTQKRR